MPTRKSPRKGSLQFWPRKRASKLLPRVNWDAVDSEKKLQGFICYKAGMKSALVKDNSPTTMTKGKDIVVPCTILECPPVKIFSVRYYKNKKPVSDMIVSNDKELKSKLKVPKTVKASSDVDSFDKEKYDDVQIIIYSLVKKTNIKKTPDLIEVAIGGSLDEKLGFIKENIDKEISFLNFIEANELVDLRGLTKGKGFSGPVKRFGIDLKAKKSEKGQRRPGNVGPWHPARVTFKVPMAGQLGMFTRVIYNNKVLTKSKASEKPLKGLKNFGDVKTDYIVIVGSVQGPAKRQLIITPSFRKTKKQENKNYEFKELR